MHRRTFVQALGATLLAPAAACASARAGTSGGGRRLERIGIQLYTLRDAAQASLDRTLADIAATGYTDVEMLMSMRNFGHTPKEVRAMLDKHGLRAPSTHIGTATLTNVDAAVDEARTLGHSYLVLANLPDEGRKSLETFREWGDRLNRAGEAARKHDLWITWHDEPQDFPSFGGVQGYDALVERLDPSLVRLQLDTGNAAMGGRDPMDLMNRYGDRYWSFHIKDAPAMPSPRDAELGKGIIDFRALLAKVKNPGEKHFFVEQETYPGTPLDSVKRDYAYLSALRF
ncbi:MAG TPA: TIM barrel protein [Gemmatimonadaceae bacterium]|nr:TIM barrel protein [Gemmatimonadaceae bacterium]